MMSSKYTGYHNNSYQYDYLLYNAINSQHCKILATKIFKDQLHTGIMKSNRLKFEIDLPNPTTWMSQEVSKWFVSRL